MINFNGKRFATAQEVDEINAKTLNARRLADYNNWRKRETNRLKKFESVPGVVLVYEETPDLWHKWNDKPDILFNGFIFYTGFEDTRKPISLRPAWCHRGSGELTTEQEEDLKNSEPQKVGTPTAKKLEAWKAYGEKMINYYNEADKIATDRRAKNTKKLDSIPGIKKTRDQWFLTRGGIERRYFLNNQGIIYWDDRIDYNAKSELFADIIVNN